MILVHRGIDQYTVLISNLQEMEGIAICINICSRPVKFVAVYLSTLLSLGDADLLDCAGGETPFLSASDMNAKHKDWNPRSNSPR